MIMEIVLGIVGYYLLFSFVVALFISQFIAVGEGLDMVKKD